MILTENEKRYLQFLINELKKFEKQDELKQAVSTTDSPIKRALKHLFNANTNFNDIKVVAEISQGLRILLSTTRTMGIEESIDVNNFHHLLATKFIDPEILSKINHELNSTISSTSMLDQFSSTENQDIASFSTKQDVASSSTEQDIASSSTERDITSSSIEQHALSVEPSTGLSVNQLAIILLDEANNFSLAEKNLLDSLINKLKELPNIDYFKEPISSNHDGNMAKSIRGLKHLFNPQTNFSNVLIQEDIYQALMSVCSSIGIPIANMDGIETVRFLTKIYKNPRILSNISHGLQIPIPSMPKDLMHFNQKVKNDASINLQRIQTETIEQIKNSLNHGVAIANRCLENLDILSTPLSIQEINIKMVQNIINDFEIESLKAYEEIQRKIKLTENDISRLIEQRKKNINTGNINYDLQSKINEILQQARTDIKFIADKYQSMAAIKLNLLSKISGQTNLSKDNSNPSIQDIPSPKIDVSSLSTEQYPPLPSTEQYSPLPSTEQYSPALSIDNASINLQRIKTETMSKITEILNDGLAISELCLKKLNSIDLTLSNRVNIKLVEDIINYFKTSSSIADREIEKMIKENENTISNLIDRRRKFTNARGNNYDITLIINQHLQQTENLVRSLAETYQRITEMKLNTLRDILDLTNLSRDNSNPSTQAIITDPLEEPARIEQTNFHSILENFLNVDDIIQQIANSQIDIRHLLSDLKDNIQDSLIKCHQHSIGEDIQVLGKHLYSNQSIKDYIINAGYGYGSVMPAYIKDFFTGLETPLFNLTQIFNEPLLSSITVEYIKCLNRLELQMVQKNIDNDMERTFELQEPAKVFIYALLVAGIKAKLNSNSSNRNHLKNCNFTKKSMQQVLFDENVYQLPSLHEFLIIWSKNHENLLLQNFGNFYEIIRTSKFELLDQINDQNILENLAQNLEKAIIDLVQPILVESSTNQDNRNYRFSR